LLIAGFCQAKSLISDGIATPENFRWSEILFGHWQHRANAPTNLSRNSNDPGGFSRIQGLCDENKDDTELAGWLSWEAKDT